MFFEPFHKFCYDYRGEGVVETVQPAVIPSQDTLIGDLLALDLNPPIIQSTPQPAGYGGGNLDLLSGGLDALVSHVNFS